jgi:hypothetical protein
VAVDSESEAKLLYPYTFKEVGEYFDYLNLDGEIAWWDYPYNLYVSLHKAENPSLSLSSLVEATGWAKPYSLSDYAQAIQAVFTRSKIQDIKIGLEDVDGYTIMVYFECQLASLNATISNEIDYRLAQIKSVHEEALNDLTVNLDKNSVVTLFRFPPTIKTTCQQYLLYFVQFLEDLGITANSEIKDDAGSILFSVTPTDGSSALGKIKDALEVYLDLPRNPEFNTAVGEFSNLAVSQLKANVFFLKSQIALAQAMLETKNATIEALNFTVFQQRQLLTEPILAKNITEENKDSEPIIGDTVHLTKYEGKFLKVDLPTILRRLKRSFGIEKDKE